MLNIYIYGYERENLHFIKQSRLMRLNYYYIALCGALDLNEFNSDPKLWFE